MCASQDAPRARQAKHSAMVSAVMEALLLTDKAPDANITCMGSNAEHEK